MIRVLFVSGGVLNHGGITTHMMNYYRNFDCNKVQIDFAVHGGKGVFDEEIKSRGGKVFYVPAKKENPVKNYTELIKIFKQYSIVHCHMDGMNGMVLGMAKKAGVPIRISHSHNTEHLTCNQLKLAIHEHYKRMIPKTATHLWCCSSEAGRWLYGSRKFRVIPNAFDIRKYRFCQDKRDRLRSAYSCEDKYVIGHVGRLDYQKNQEYLLRIFREAIRGGGNEEETAACFSRRWA